MFARTECDAGIDQDRDTLLIGRPDMAAVNPERPDGQGRKGPHGFGDPVLVGHLFDGQWHQRPGRTQRLGDGGLQALGNRLVLEQRSDRPEAVGLKLKGGDGKGAGILQRKVCCLDHRFGQCQADLPRRVVVCHGRVIARVGKSRAQYLGRTDTPERDQASLTKSAMTFFWPALSNVMSSLLPSMDLTMP